ELGGQRAAVQLLAEALAADEFVVLAVLAWQVAGDVVVLGDDVLDGNDGLVHQRNGIAVDGGIESGLVDAASGRQRVVGAGPFRRCGGSWGFGSGCSGCWCTGCRRSLGSGCLCHHRGGAGAAGRRSSDMAAEKNLEDLVGGLVA